MSKELNRVIGILMITIAMTAALLILLYVAFEQFEKYPALPIRIFTISVVCVFGIASFYGMLKKNLMSAVIVFSGGVFGVFVSASPDLLNRGNISDLLTIVGGFSVVLVGFYFAIWLIGRLRGFAKRKAEHARSDATQSEMS